MKSTQLIFFLVLGLSMYTLITACLNHSVTLPGKAAHSATQDGIKATSDNIIGAGGASTNKFTQEGIKSAWQSIKDW